VDIDNTTGGDRRRLGESRMRNERLARSSRARAIGDASAAVAQRRVRNYELFSRPFSPAGRRSVASTASRQLCRQAYKDGIAMQDTRGYNPYKFGMAGGSDSHNSAAPYRRTTFFGLHGRCGRYVERRFCPRADRRTMTCG